MAGDRLEKVLLGIALAANPAPRPTAFQTPVDSSQSPDLDLLERLHAKECARRFQNPMYTLLEGVEHLFASLVTVSIDA
jgi:hypothetical protein